MNNDRSACRFLKQRDLMTERISLEFTCFQWRWWRWQEEEGKDMEKKRIFIHKSRHLLPLPLSTTYVSCNVFFSIHNNYLWSSRAEKSWLPMACIDAIMKIIETCNVSLDFDIRFFAGMRHWIQWAYFICRTIFVWEWCQATDGGMPEK